MEEKNTYLFPPLPLTLKKKRAISCMGEKLITEEKGLIEIILKLGRIREGLFG